MTEQIQPDSHPDAELLNAFVEGVLPEHERSQCLAHLAECARCREVVFLAKPEPNVATQAAAIPTRRRWFGMAPAMMSGALAASALLVGILVYRTQTVTPSVPVRSTPALAPTIADRVVPRQPQAEAPPPIRAKKAPKSEVTTGAAALPAVPAPPPPSAPAPLSAVAPKQSPVAQEARAAEAAQPVVPDELHSSLATGNLREPTTGLGAIQGRVEDATGAAVVGATVKVQEVNTQVSTNVTSLTSTKGEFKLDALPPGVYDVQVESPGFQKSSTTVDLKANDVAVVTPKLTVGAAAATVEVTASKATVQTETAQLQTAGRSTPVRDGSRVLALAPSGGLLLSKDAGKSWKAVKPKWPGKVTRIEFLSEKKGKFEITTDRGAVWQSEDGSHWRPKK